MIYQRSVSISGDTRKALDYIQTIFAQNNFQVKQSGSKELELTGPGMNSTKQNPLTGVSKARIKLTGQKIKMEAELGGVRFMQWFISLFPPALGFFLFVFFYMKQHSFQAASPALFAIAPWLVIAPLMGRWIKTRTVKALDILLNNTLQNQSGD